MKNLKIFLICILLFFLERVFFARVEIFSLTPWLLLTFCCLASTISKEAKSLFIISGICGFVSGIASGSIIANVLLYLFSSIVLYHISAFVLKHNIFVSVALTFILEIVCQMLYCLAEFPQSNMLSVLFRVVVPTCAIDAVFAFALYPIAKKLFLERRIRI